MFPSNWNVVQTWAENGSRKQRDIVVAGYGVFANLYHEIVGVVRKLRTSSYVTTLALLILL